MRRSALAAVLVLAAASSAAAQWIERTIWLPDSLSALPDPRCLLYVPEVGRVYVGGGENELPANGLIAIDAASRTKVARSMVPGVVTDLAYWPAGNKLYAAADSLRVLDAATHQLVGVVPGFRRPLALAVSPEAGKLYALSGDNLYVVDCTADTLLTWFEVGDAPEAVCYASFQDKVYTANTDSESVTVVDGAADTVLAVIPVARAPLCLVHNPGGGRVYCCCVDDDELTVIDCRGDSVRARLAVDYPWAGAYNPATGRAYFSGSEGLVVVDGTGDSIVNVIPTGVIEGAVCCSPTTGRVFCTSWSEGAVKVFDCAGDSLLAVLPASRGAELLCVDSSGPAVYCASQSDRLTVVDAQADTVLAVMDCGPLYPDRLLAHPDEGKVYVLTDGFDWIRGDTAVLVVDAAGCSLAGFLDLRAEPSAMVLNPARGKLYVALNQGWTTGRDSVLAVFSTGDDSLLGVVMVGEEPLCLACDTARDKVFCGTGEGVRVVDCALDSVVAGLFVRLENLLAVPELGRVYGTAGTGEMTVLDADSDTLVTRVGTGGWGAGPMCYASREQKVYVSHWQSGNVAAVDAVNNVRVATIPVGRSPSDLCYNPQDNRVFCANGGSSQQPDSTVTVIDCRTDSVLATVVVGAGPAALQFNPLNDKVYCACSGDGTVAVIDGRTSEVVAVLATGSTPVDLAWIPTTNRVFASNLWGSSVTVLRDSLVPGIEEEGPVFLSGRTILRGPELLSLDCRVIDALGRDVTDRRDRLAPGVYFIGEGPRGPGFEGSRVRKVVVQR